MDRDVPARVTYWIGTWEPTREAISKEVELLRSRDDLLQPVIAFSSGHASGLDVGRRVLRLSSRRWTLMRALAPIAEWSGDINHVFGGLESWHLLRCLGRRPTVLTVSLPGGHAVNAARVDVFVAESERLVDELRQSGVPAERIRLIYPGVDLDAYRPGPPPPGPFRVLFASSPSDPAEFDVRGINVLVETARACPEMEFVFLWRQWGDQHAARAAFERLAPPPNVCLERADAADMPSVYRKAHAIACLYAEGFGKSCPNSVVEAMACGLPALVADNCGIARLIVDGGAGIGCTRRAAEIAAGARLLRERHGAFRRAARQVAERAFDAKNFLESYRRLYSEIRAVPVRALAGSAVPASAGMKE
jgi:glycosyltransferase involved in cell wall biosynthesis